MFKNHTGNHHNLNRTNINFLRLYHGPFFIYITLGKKRNHALSNFYVFKIVPVASLLSWSLDQTPVVWMPTCRQLSSSGDVDIFD